MPRIDQEPMPAAPPGELGSSRQAAAGQRHYPAIPPWDTVPALEALGVSGPLAFDLGEQENDDALRRRTFVGLTSTSLLRAITDAAPGETSLDAEPLASALAGHPDGTGLEQPGPPADVAALPAAVSDARRQYQACRYSELIKDLPRLLARLHAACQSLDDEAASRAFGLSADAYHVAAGLLLKLDDPGLAYLAADRSMRAASASEDPVTAGASARIITHALMHGGHLAAAISTASSHAARLDGVVSCHTPESLSVYGSLLLRGAIAAAQHGNRGTALELLGEADDAARRLGADGNLRWTAFGPTNVSLHRVNIASPLAMRERPST
jgi:hypothetical protein